MELAQEYVDIMHVSQGSIFHLFPPATRSPPISASPTSR